MEGLYIENFENATTSGTGVLRAPRCGPSFSLPQSYGFRYHVLTEQNTALKFHLSLAAQLDMPQWQTYTLR